MFVLLFCGWFISLYDNKYIYSVLTTKYTTYIHEMNSMFNCIRNINANSSLPEINITCTNLRIPVLM